MKISQPHSTPDCVLLLRHAQGTPPWVCSPSLPMMIITNAGSTNTAHHHWQLTLVSALLREGAWVTRPERPKGAKDEVKVARRATN